LKTNPLLTEKQGHSPLTSHREGKQKPCLYCQKQPLGQELKIDQKKLSHLNYEYYKARLRQEKSLVYQSGKGYGEINPKSICSKCEKPISQSPNSIIKNRYKPLFWGLKTPYKALCLNCLQDWEGEMPPPRKKLFHQYLQRYY